MLNTVTLFTASWIWAYSFPQQIQFKLGYLPLFAICVIYLISINQTHSVVHGHQTVNLFQSLHLYLRG